MHCFKLVHSQEQSSVPLIEIYFRGDIRLNKVVSSLLILSFCALFIATDANAIAGGRLQSEPKSPVIVAERYYNKGMKASDKATNFEKSAETASSNSKKQRNLANAEKQRKRAIRFYEKALKVFPDIASVRTELGYELIKTGNYSEALEILDEALRRNAENEKALAYRAEALAGLEMQNRTNESELFNISRHLAPPTTDRAALFMLI